MKYVRFFRWPLFTAFLSFAAGSFAVQASSPAGKLETAAIRIAYDRQGVTSLSSVGPAPIEFLAPNQRLGELSVKYRVGHEDWLEPYTEERRLLSNHAGSVIEYSDSPFGTALQVMQRFEAKGSHLDWSVELKSDSNRSVTVGDLAFALPWRRPNSEDPVEIFEKSFTKHQFISGHGAFLYFTKPNGEGPFLLVTTLPGTKLEYYAPAAREDGAYRCFVHSAYSADLEHRGSWRMPNTSLTLESGQVAHYGLRFQWARSYDEMRDMLYREGLFDIRVVPGMTVPNDLSARFSLRTKARIDAILPEFPKQTHLKSLGVNKAGFHLYEVRFQRLGENLLTIKHDRDRKTYLEFFSTEPLETLIKKRARFITQHQQHRVPGRWYDGLYSVYDMREGRLRGPNDTDGFDGWWGYVLACDDPALCKAPFVASKNFHFPDKAEIASLEYYIKHFVWGGLQRTDKESPYPYGVYGTPNWRVNRDPLLRAKGRSSNLEKMHVWRSYDYPHIAMLYFHMYQIAKAYPRLVHYLDAKGYLERACQTARAYFTYPYEILPWYETYKWGCYNELVILDLVSALEQNGRKADADWLRAEWEKKVKYFVYDDKYPFRSEYAIDRTAFESSYAFAKYGATHDMKPDHNLWFDKAKNRWYSHPVVSREDSRIFMDRQLQANLAVRGWLEASYYLLGADFTASSDTFALSYMANMGGWGILDYGVNFADKPYDWLQLGYASYLSSWCLMNTGRADTDYGFWFPGEKNDGAAGWQFMPAKFGHSWARNKEEVRGPWHYDGEIDLGFGAGLRMAATVLTDDPVFGWFAYGGQLKSAGQGLCVVPRDGLRQRFYAVVGKQRLRLELERDGFAADEALVTDRSLGSVQGILENRTHDTHPLRIHVSAAGMRYEVFLGEVRLGITEPGRESTFESSLPFRGASIRLIKR